MSEKKKILQDAKNKIKTLSLALTLSSLPNFPSKSSIFSFPFSRLVSLSLSRGKMESTTPPPLEDDEWEVCSDGDFIYKRRKRHALDPPPHGQPEPDPPAAASRKRKALLKLRDRYRKEIDHWEYLSNALLALEETTRQLRLQRGQATPSLYESSPSVVAPAMDYADGSIVDDLLLQVRI